MSEGTFHYVVIHMLQQLSFYLLFSFLFSPLSLIGKYIQYLPFDDESWDTIKTFSRYLTVQSARMPMFSCDFECYEYSKPVNCLKINMLKCSKSKSLY